MDGSRPEVVQGDPSYVDPNRSTSRTDRGQLCSEYNSLRTFYASPAVKFMSPQNKSTSKTIIDRTDASFRENYMASNHTTSDLFFVGLQSDVGELNSILKREDKVLDLRASCDQSNPTSSASNPNAIHERHRPDDSPRRTNDSTRSPGLHTRGRDSDDK